MKTHRFIGAGLAVWAVFGGCAAFAASFPDHDLEGSKDDPLLTRYPGSLILAYFKKPFDETDLIAGPFKLAGANTLPYEKIIHVEGAITRIVYVFPSDRSALDVMRNYTDALRKANLSVLYSCDKTACGGDASRNFSGSFSDAKLTLELEHWQNMGQRRPVHRSVQSIALRTRQEHGRRRRHHLCGGLRESAHRRARRRVHRDREAGPVANGSGIGEPERRRHGEGHQRRRARGAL